MIRPSFTYLKAFCLLLPASLLMTQKLQGALDYQLRKPDLSQKQYLPDSGRPIRAGFIRISDQLDRSKPLAMADFSGMTEASGLLIGSVTKDWISGMQYPSMKPEWWIKAPADLTIPPTVFGSWGVLGFRNGQLSKFNARTGQIEWDARLDTFAARTVIKTGNKLIVVTASQSVYALDYQTGKAIWIYDGEDPDGIAVHTVSPPVIHQKTVYVGMSSGDVVAINLENGKKNWSHNPAFNEQRFHDVIGDMQVIDNTLVLSRYDGVVAGINIENPAKPPVGWEEPKKFNTITANAFRHGRMYIGTNNGYIYALNPRNGQKLWEAFAGTSVSSITPGETRLYTAGSSGRINALDSQTGTVYWYDQIEGAIASKPVYVDKKLYFSTGLKVLYGYQMR